MKKIVLIDGNNFMFRSYYATAYTGNIMKNSKGFPTNALYGFTSMINKIISEEKPDYMAVAFDIGKNFRKEKYDFYKEGRNTTPPELKMQMPVARDLLDAMGIKYLELAPYEADDIIGTLVKKISLDDDFNATIISSDKDLLQLINFETDYKLLKSSGSIRLDEKTFKEQYGFEPIKVIDLKALMGDSSDNIPGVKGIGEKTAIKLLQEYGSLDGIYNHIDEIKGATKEKLLNDKKNAYMSYEIATIFCDVPLDISLESLKYNGPDSNKLFDLYSKLEFTSLLKNIKKSINEQEEKFILYNKDVNVVLKDDISLYVECDNEIYTHASLLGAALTDGCYTYYFDKEYTCDMLKFIEGKNITTYDYKKCLYFMDTLKVKDDIMISSYLLGYNVKDDISNLASDFGEILPSLNETLKLEDNNFKSSIVKKVLFIQNKKDEIKKILQENNMVKLYEEIEMPLIKVLSKMEKNGVKVSKDVLISYGQFINNEIENITNRIYEYAGCKFNISSPKQLGEILFEKLELAKGKKNKTGYKTDVATLEKLLEVHPIIKEILDYRAYAKLKSTYIDGLIDAISSDGLIHSIFKQTIARTGRLSSVEPNLQNIPTRDDLGKKIREAFIAQNDILLSCDYSQIELRLLAHISKCPSMIETFKNGGDIHAKVAADINGVDIKDVTKEMRSKAKSVIFGIVYGISGYGLMDNLHISKSEADFFINKYYEMYPEVKKYMENTVKTAKENGYVLTLFNRKRNIEELSNSNYMIRQSGERMAINTPIQGTAADIMKLAMIRINDRLEEYKLKSKMIIQVHDELIFDCKKDELDKLIEIVKYEMENVLELDVPLKVSSDTGINWYETK